MQRKQNLKFIFKNTLFYYPVCLIIFIFLLSSPLQAQQISGPQSAPGPLLIHDFSVDAVVSHDGSWNLSVKALNRAGRNDFGVHGAYLFLIEKDSVELYFTAGRAVSRIEATSEPVIIKYLGPKSLKSRIGLKPIEKLYRFREKNGRIRELHIPLWQSILPPLLAIGMALLLKEVIISLFAGIWLGSFIIYGWDFRYFFVSLARVVDTYVIRAFTDSSHASVILFSILIGGIVAVISRNGGMAGIVQKLSKYANSSRSAQFITYGLGVGIFFDDYANTLIVGNTMRPVTDRFRISREKLAYLVDSTAAPIAAIAFVTTWIGAELGYIDAAIDHLGMDSTPYAIFLGSLKYAFYPILTLIFIYFLLRFNKDYGPMHRAEMRARQSGALYEKKTGNEREGPVDDSLRSLDPVAGIRYRWGNAFFPILTVVSITMLGLYLTGYDAATWSGDASFWQKLMATVGNADSFVALIWGSTMGLLLAILLSVTSKTLSLRLAIESMMDGFKTMLPAIVILILAWSIAELTKELHTADFLTQMISGNIPPHFIPVLTFVLAAVISFSTGSSWSTMAILYPIILPMSWILGREAGLHDAALMEVIYHATAAVLGGSVLGDHCSPISDTTVLSSLASACNHIDHVRTQLPYALTVGLVSVVSSTMIILFDIPWYLNYLLGIGILFAYVRLRGRKVPVTFINSNGEAELKTDNRLPG